MDEAAASKAEQQSLCWLPALSPSDAAFTLSQSAVTTSTKPAFAAKLPGVDVDAKICCPHDLHPPLVWMTSFATLLSFAGLFSFLQAPATLLPGIDTLLKQAQHFALELLIASLVPLFYSNISVANCLLPSLHSNLSSVVSASSSQYTTTTMNNSSGSGNGQHNHSTSPSSIDFQNLENEPELPRPEPRSTGTLVAPGPGVSGPVASLPTFTMADAAETVTFTNPVAAPPVESTNGGCAADTPTPGQAAPFTMYDVTSDPDVDPALGDKELQRGLAEYVRAMNNLGPQRLPPGAAVVPVMAPPPFGVGLFAPAVTVTAAAQVVNVASTAPAVNGGVAAPPAPTSATAPTAEPAPMAASPRSAGGHRRHSHGGAAFDEHGQLRVRPDGSLYLEHTPPSTSANSASPSPPPTTAADPTAPAAEPSSPPVAATIQPHVAASPPRPPAVSITPPTPMPVAFTGNTAEPVDPELAEFFDFGAAAE